MICPATASQKVDKQEKLRWGKMMQDYFEQSDELRHVLCLVDIRHEPTEDDKQMNFLRQMGILFTVIATRRTRSASGARQKQLAPICRALLVQPWEVICWSSEDGTGRDQLLTLLEKVLAPEEEAPEARHASSIRRIRWELPGESGWMEECSNEKETQCPR